MEVHSMKSTPRIIKSHVHPEKDSTFKKPQIVGTNRMQILSTKAVKKR